VLQGVAVQCPEYFIFVMEGTGKKRKRGVLTIKAKIGLSMNLLGAVRYILIIIF
jgi:hypothetical protein